MLCSLICMAVACTMNSTTTGPMSLSPTATPVVISSSPTATPTPYTLTYLYATYISSPIGSSASCVSCHGSLGASGVQVNASSQSAFYSSMLNQLSTDGCATTFVMPNNTSQSTLYLRLAGACGSPSAQMPNGGPTYLTASQLAEFASWINAGAQNN